MSWDELGLYMYPSNVPEQAAWFVMRAYKSEKRAEEALSGEGGLKYFIPKHYVMRVYHGVKSRRLVPVIPSLVFVYATREQLVDFKKRNNYLQFVMWEKRSGLEYLTVPEDQMDSFIKVSSLQEAGTVYLNPDEVDLSKGTRVLIHGGRFDGVTGTFMQVKGKRNRRIVVLLDSVLAVAAEVDPELLEIL